MYMKRWKEEIIVAFRLSEKSKVLELIKIGFPVNSDLCIKDSNGEILIKKTFCCHLCCEYGYFDILQKLVFYGCNLEAIDSFHRTPLMIACETGYLDIVKYLCINCKVKITGFNIQGMGNIHIAAINGKIDILKFFINDLGISALVLNQYKATTLDLCREIYIKDQNENLEAVLIFLKKFTLPTLDSQFIYSDIIDTYHIYNCHIKCKDFLNINNQQSINELPVKNKVLSVLNKSSSTQLSKNSFVRATNRKYLQVINSSRNIIASTIRNIKK